MKTDCIHYSACKRIQSLNKNPYMYCEGCNESQSRHSLVNALNTLTDTWIMCVRPKQED